MGKRTSEKTDDEIKHKIRRLEKELKSRQQPPDNYEMKDPEYDSRYEHEDEEFEAYDAGSGSRAASDEEVTTEHHRQVESVVRVPAPTPGSLPHMTALPEKSAEESGEELGEQPMPTEGEENAIPSEILAILGEAKKSDETFGKNIPGEISERWGKILIEGLMKEQKETLLMKTLIPENFQLAKAPKLNAEVASVLGEPAKNRDKRLEKIQNQLGSGIAGLANLTSDLIGKDLSKLDIIKQISEINQILLDLHYEETMNRRRLIIPMLDKSFINIIQGVKREKFLFGDSLGENIKTTKSIEKTSLQIKKSVPSQPSTSRRTTTAAQGNFRAPPRQPSGQGVARAPRAQARYYTPLSASAGRRPLPPPAPYRQPPPPPSRPQERRCRR